MFKVFTRNWWKIEGGLKVPDSTARKTIIGYCDTKNEAREMCYFWNAENAEKSRNIKLGRMCEFQKV